MQPSYAIRETRPGDAEALPGVERSAARAFLAIPELAWIADDAVQSVEQHRAFMADGHSWTAVDGRDAPAGFLTGETIGDTLHIWECAVRLDCQRRGIASALVECARTSARRQGLARMSLTTFRHVVWNRPFYERLGFRVLPEDEIPAYLRAILDEEAACGFSAELRCAMLCPLDGRQAGGKPG